MRRSVYAVLLLSLAGCASQYHDRTAADPYGFFIGLWHGAIWFFSLAGVLISWTLSLFGLSVLSDVTIIGKPNTGFGYYTGFALGVFLSAGGGRTGKR